MEWSGLPELNSRAESITVELHYFLASHCRYLRISQILYYVCIDVNRNSKTSQVSNVKAHCESSPCAISGMSFTVPIIPTPQCYCWSFTYSTASGVPQMVTCLSPAISVPSAESNTKIHTPAIMETHLHTLIDAHLVQLVSLLQNHLVIC